MENVGSIVASLKLDLTSFNAGIAKVFGGVKRLESRLSKLTAASLSAAAGLNSAVAPTKKLSAATNKAALSASRFSLAAGGITSALTSIGPQIAIISLALVGLSVKLGVDAVKAAASFNQEIANAGARIGATPGQLKALEDAAINVGINTSLSAKEAAQGITELSKAGLSVAQQVGLIEPVARFAEAGLLSLSDAAAITVNVLSGYGKGVEEAAAVTDLLTTTANSVTASVGEIGEAFAKVGPIASSAGVSIEDTATAIGLLQQTGTKGAKAGTVLKTALIQLLDPTTKGAAALKKLGVEAKDIEDNLRSPLEIFKELGAAGATTTDLIRIFGKEGAAIAGPIGLGAKAIDDLSRKIEDAGGAAERISKLQLNTFQGQLGLVKSSAETLQIQLGQLVVAGLKPLARELADTSAAAVSGGKAVDKFARALEAGLRSTSKFLKSLKPFVPIFDIVIAALTIVNAGFSTMNSIFGIVRNSVLTLVSALATSLLSALGGVLEATEFVAGAFDASLARGIGKARKAVKDLATAGAGLAVGFGTNVVDNFKQIGSNAVTVAKTLKDLATGNGQLTKALNKGIEVSEAAADGIKEFGSRVADTGAAVLELGGAASGAANDVGKIGDAADTAAGKLSRLTRSLLSAVQAAKSDVSGAFGAVNVASGAAESTAGAQSLGKSLADRITASASENIDKILADEAAKIESDAVKFRTKVNKTSADISSSAQSLLTPLITKISEADTSGVGVALEAAIAGAAVGGPLGAAIAGLSSLADTFGVLDTITEVVISLIEPLEPALKVFGEAFNGFAKALAPLVVLFNTIPITQFGFVFGIFSKALAIVALIINTVAKVIVAIVLAVAKAINAIVQALPFFPKLKEKTAAFVSTVQDAADALDKNQKALLKTIRSEIGTGGNAKEPEEQDEAVSSAQTARDEAFTELDDATEATRAAKLLATFATIGSKAASDGEKAIKAAQEKEAAAREKAIKASADLAAAELAAKKKAAKAADESDSSVADSKKEEEDAAKAAADALDKMAKGAEAAAREFTNLPQVFNANLRAAQAQRDARQSRLQSAVDQTLEGNGGGNNFEINTDQLNINTNGATAEEIQQEILRDTFVRTGTIQKIIVPFFAPGSA